MSGSINFRSGPFKDWDVTVAGTWQDGQIYRIAVQIAAPYSPGAPERSGLLSFAPGIDGWEQAYNADIKGGPVAMAELLEWVIEATAQALNHRTDITEEHRRYWQDIIDQADHSRAEYFARYPDGQEFLEVIASLVYDSATDELVAA